MVFRSFWPFKSHLISLAEDLHEKGVGFRSICDGSLDTTTASDELIFNLFSSLAQFERKLIQERTRAGLAAARVRGRMGGRKRLNVNDPRVLTAKHMHKNHGMNINEICKILKISRPSFYRYLALPDP
jgi:DNA invertase Pin-like site-specific DNA recombinase